MIHHRSAHPLASGGLTRVHRLHFGVRGIEPLERSDSYEHAASVGAKERDGRVQKAVDSQGMHVARRRYPSGERQVYFQQGSHVLNSGIIDHDDQSHAPFLTTGSGAEATPRGLRPLNGGRTQVDWDMLPSEDRHAT